MFLDRDGTLIEEVGYLDRPERVELYPYSIEAIRALNRAGLRVVMVTNQSGVARGFFSRSGGATRCTRTSPTCWRRAARGSTRITIVRTIPDGSVAEYARACECRKPGRGLVDRAVRELGIDPARSFTVGDRWLDVALARTVGAQGRPGANRLRR